MLLISCVFVFRQASYWFGNKAGYISGFLFYWLFWCFFIPLKLVGPGAILKLLAYKRPSYQGSSIVWLLVPLVFVYSYSFPAAIKHADFQIIIFSLLISTVNATLEEVLWRGVYFQIFKLDRYAGIVYSSAGFAIWHYAPQVIFTSTNPGGAHSFVIFAFFLGLAYSFVTWKQQSIFWVSIAHILFDFGGLGARIYFQ